ncbi:MAG: hypothetical protein HETSPECPRED_004835 [Heterodermia speciosa]|uniref:C2H2-type domain-containing protein n=1 Tax=Heterodermia speciosa TaxID=116794 RepID=A0A8H3EI29_9LECA|nr:MAG: hypothetical protein HETSPECPRED_004835 [Heterodermia speciosa]
MATSISSLIRSCLQTYESLIKDLRGSNFAHEDARICVLWEDQLGRLRVWTANIGAHQTGPSSLDYRLRDASHIRQLLVKLLEDLSQTLKDVQYLIAEDSTVDSASDDSAVSFSNDPARELTGLHEGLVSIVDCLYQTSVLVRRPARHDILIDRDPENVAKFEPYDIRHVEEKFPHMDRELARILGAANTRRRRHLNYLKRHHVKLGKGLENLGGNQSDAAMSEMSGTIATELESQIDSRAETSSETGVSQTSYATSLGTGEGLTIPALPKESIYGSPFECPYCFHMITIQRHGEWQKHIMEDITPYSCIFPDCHMQNRLFASRHEWFGHLQKVHRLYLSQRGEDYEMSPRTESKNVDSPATENCPLCAESLSSLRQFERHVARHLQELALFVLNRQETDDTDELLSEAASVSSDEADELTQFKMVIHLPNGGEERRIAKVKVGSSFDVVSKSVADALGMKMESYDGGDIKPLEETLRPLGQLMLDWHVMGKGKTYTTTFLVLESDDFDVLLGDETIGKIGFVKVNSRDW